MNECDKLGFRWYLESWCCIVILLAEGRNKLRSIVSISFPNIKNITWLSFLLTLQVRNISRCSEGLMGIYLLMYSCTCPSVNSGIYLLWIFQGQTKRKFGSKNWVHLDKCIQTQSRAMWQQNHHGVLSVVLLGVLISLFSPSHFKVWRWTGCP